MADTPKPSDSGAQDDKSTLGGAGSFLVGAGVSWIGRDNWAGFALIVIGVALIILRVVLRWKWMKEPPTVR